MRPVALGRKNWMHLGSQESGPPVAAIMTVLASAQRAGLNVRAYLADCLDALADRHFTTSPPANFRPCCPSPGKRASPEPAPPQSPFPRVAAPLHRWWRPPPTFHSALLPAEQPIISPRLRAPRLPDRRRC
jgi:hypothetical protein